SHVPHFAAVALVQNLLDSHEDVQLLKLLSGNGLRDTTRIAMGSPQMWSEICRHNGEEIAALLRKTAAQLEDIATVIGDGNLRQLEEGLDAVAKLREKL